MKGVFFDIGSTLVTGPDISPSKAIAKILNIDANLVKDIIMVTDLTSSSDLVKALANIVKVEELTVHTDKIVHLWDTQESAAKEITGAAETVKSLKKMGLLIGLISDIWSPYYKSFKRACPDIAAIADSAALSFKDGVRKPNPVLFEKALASLNLTPDAAVMVGDSYVSDIEPAMMLGMRTVWCLFRPDSELSSIVRVFNGELKKPDYVIGTISQLLTLDLWS